MCFETQRLTTTTVQVKHTTEKSFMQSKTNCYILTAMNTRKLFSILLNATKWEFLEAGGQLWTISYVKVGHAIPHSKGLRTHNTSVKSFFSNFIHMLRAPQHIKILGLGPIALHPYPKSEECQLFSSKLHKTFATRQYGSFFP